MLINTADRKSLMVVGGVEQAKLNHLLNINHPM